MDEKQTGENKHKIYKKETMNNKQIANALVQGSVRQNVRNVWKV